MGDAYFYDKQTDKVCTLHSNMLFVGEQERNVVLWMDHRSAEQAFRITSYGHRVLRRVGGVMSPEMQPPKLLWLKEVRGHTVKKLLLLRSGLTAAVHGAFTE